MEADNLGAPKTMIMGIAEVLRLMERDCRRRANKGSKTSIIRNLARAKAYADAADLIDKAIAIGQPLPPAPSVKCQ